MARYKDQVATAEEVTRALQEQKALLCGQCYFLLGVRNVALSMDLFFFNFRGKESVSVKLIMLEMGWHVN